MSDALADYDFELPPGQIAQAPLADRSASRLLVLPRAGGGRPEHRGFKDLVELLDPGSLLVLNETRVIPARLRGKRAATGGKVEVLLVRPTPSGAWEALVQAGGAIREGERVVLGDAAALVLEAKLGDGRWRVAFPGQDALAVAEAHGALPLPPYIKRPASAQDAAAYQTVFARVPGAIAAPTAGLHFTPEVLAALEARGVQVARLVLHVGLGTFSPVRVESLDRHAMHAERYEVPAATAAAVGAARQAGRPVVAVGTTVVRTLEAWARTGALAGETDLFIRPPFEFRAVDALVTNFHLPQSTLLVLVSAFAGRERVLAAYREAVAAGYRFFSYGDAMFIR